MLLHLSLHLYYADLQSSQGVYLILTPCQTHPTTAALEPLQGLDLSRNSVHEVTNAFQNIGVSKTPPTQPESSLVATSHLGPAPTGLHVQQQQVAVYPVLYPGLQPAGRPRFMFDHIPTRSHSFGQVNPLAPMSGGLPMGALYPTRVASMMMHSDFAAPNTIHPFGHLDNRRQNAMRVSRSPYSKDGNNNKVDVIKIRDGIDVRTTVSSLPNR